MPKLFQILRQILFLALATTAAFFLCLFLTPWPALAAWALLMAFLCTLSAILLRTSPMGKLTWRNRLAGFLLPWGYRLSSGSLPAITFAAWFIWVLIAASTILLLHPSRPAAFPTLSTLALLAAWFLYGALTIRLLGLAFKNFRQAPRPRRTMLLLSLAMLALIAASGTLHLLHHPRLASLVAAAPILVLGTGYALFLAIMLIFGRKARWN